MFVGRHKELELLEELYKSQKFEMLILHGRRRIGKSFLLSHFASLHSGSVVYWTADKSDEATNVRSFCEELGRVLSAGEYLASLRTWQQVYAFINDREISQRLVLIIDEFTYLYHSNPAFDSGLQNAIDRILKHKNIMLVLCGSEVSVIEDIFNSSAKPLYGRKTAELKLFPFTYLEAREFFPQWTNEQVLTAYSILGGVPLYLSLFDDNLTIEQNVVKVCLSNNGYLFSEPETLLRMELTETYFYRSILSAIGTGASTFSQICSQAGDISSKVAKYIGVLINLGLIRKDIPCGEKEKSRNAIYSIADNYLAFYFRFIYRYRNMLNGLIDPNLFYQRELTDEHLSAFIGLRFEDICRSYLRQQFYLGRMPFFAEDLGRWWGNNPAEHRQDEIDIVALDSENVLFCECKWTNRRFDIHDLSDLKKSSVCINRPHQYFMIFAKNGVTDEVSAAIGGNQSYFVVTMNELFK